MFEKYIKVIHFTVAVQFMPYNVRRTVYAVQFTSYSVRRTMYAVQCAVYADVVHGRGYDITKQSVCE